MPPRLINTSEARKRLQLNLLESVSRNLDAIAEGRKQTITATITDMVLATAKEDGVGDFKPNHKTAWAKRDQERRNQIVALTARRDSYRQFGDHRYALHCTDDGVIGWGEYPGPLDMTPGHRRVMLSDLDEFLEANPEPPRWAREIHTGIVYHGSGRSVIVPTDPEDEEEYERIAKLRGDTEDAMLRQSFYEHRRSAPPEKVEAPQGFREDVFFDEEGERVVVRTPYLKPPTPRDEKLTEEVGREIDKAIEALERDIAEVLHGEADLKP